VPFLLLLDEQVISYKIEQMKRKERKWYIKWYSILGFIGLLTGIFWWLSGKSLPELLRTKPKQVISGEDIKGIVDELERRVSLKSYLDGLPQTENIRLGELFQNGEKAMSNYKWQIAVDSFRLALNYAQGREIIALQMLLGNCFFAVSKLDTALIYFNSSLILANALCDSEAIRINLDNIGAIYQETGDSDKALNFFKLSLNLNEKFDDKEGIATELGRIGTIYMYKGDLIKALKYFNKSLKISKEIGDKEGEAKNLGDIALLDFLKGESKTALEKLNVLLKIYDSIGDRVVISKTYGNIGTIYLEKEEFDSAGKYLRDALKVNKEIGNKKAEAINYTQISYIYLTRLKLDSTSVYLDSALNAFKQIGAEKEVERTQIIIRLLTGRVNSRSALRS